MMDPAITAMLQDKIATPTGYQPMGSMTAADLDLVIAYRRQTHDRTGVPWSDVCQKDVDFFQALADMMRRFDKRTVRDVYTDT